VKAAQDMALNIDVHAGERVCWLTDLGWMMGPWLLYGALILGATVCLYDGAPDYPAPDRLWAFCAKHQVNVLGLSPTLIRGLSAHDSYLPMRHDLSALRVLASSGEPWNPAPWWWPLADHKLLGWNRDFGRHPVEYSHPSHQAVRFRQGMSGHPRRRPR
jgi:acetyl-CoA synthetase